MLSLLYKSLLRRRLEQVVELQPGSHHLLLLRIVSTVLRSLPPGHVEEYDQSHQSHEQHSAGYGGDDQTGPFFINKRREVVWNVKNRLDQSFFWRYFQHVVQLESGRSELLLGWTVVALSPPLSSGHDKEDKETNQCYECHTTHYWSNY